MALQDVDGPFTTPVPMAATMTLRDYFAGQALASMFRDEWTRGEYRDVARRCHLAADAMLAQRADPPRAEP